MKPADGYNYQPVMIITLLQNNGKATREKIEEEIKKNNHHHLPWKTTEYPFKVLVKHKVCKYNESDKIYELLDFETFPDDNSQWQSVLVTKCKERMGKAKSFSKIESKSCMLLTHKTKNKWRDDLGKRYHYNIKTVHYSKDLKPGTKTIWFYRKAKKYHFWGYGEVSSILDKDKDITNKNERIAIFDNFNFFNEDKSPIITSALIDQKVNGKMKNIRDPLIVIDQEIHDEVINYKPKYMPRVVLFSVAGSAAYDHYKETVINDVSTSDFTNSEMKQFDKVRTWGAIDRPKNNNRSKWSKLKKGDILLFYKDKQYVASVVLQGTEDNMEVARKMWGEKIDHDEMNIEAQSGETWQLITYALPDGVHECEVDSDKFNKLVGYQDNFMPTRTLDFSPIKKEKLEALVEKFGSVHKALESIGFNFGTMLSAEIEDLIVRFDENRNFFKSDRKSEQELLDIINEFRSIFPPERIPSLTLDEYVLGKPLADGTTNRETFCWWLENGTRKLGNIGIWGASEFGVYWKKSESAYTKLNIFEERNITTINEAFTTIKNEITSIINAGSEYQKDHDKEKLIKAMDVHHKDRFLTTAIRSKILYLYFPHEFLAVFAFSTMIKPIMQVFGFPENEIEDKNIVMQFKLLNLKNSHPIMSKWRNADYSHFLWSIKKRLLDNKDEDADDDIEEEILLEDIADQILKDGSPKTFDLAVEKSVVVRILRHLDAGKNVILVGAPGVGKTELAKRILSIFGMIRTKDEDYVKSVATDEWTRWDVIGGMYEGEFKPGCVTEAVKKKVWLLIDEFNRADINKAFGEMFLAVEDKKIPLKDSEQKALGEDYIEIPDKFRIIGTMNDFDKNLLLTELSYGLITRFAFVDIEPDRDKEKESVKVQIVGRNKIEDTDYEACKGEITGFFTFINKVRDVRMIGVRTCIDVIRYMVTASKNHSDGRKDYLDDAMCDYLLPQFDRLDRRTLEATKNATKGLGAKKFTDGLQKLLDELNKIMAAFGDVEKKEE